MAKKVQDVQNTEVKIQASVSGDSGVGEDRAQDRALAQVKKNNRKTFVAAAAAFATWGIVIFEVMQPASTMSSSGIVEDIAISSTVDSSGSSIVADGTVAQDTGAGTIVAEVPQDGNVSTDSVAADGTAQAVSSDGLVVVENQMNPPAWDGQTQTATVDPTSTAPFLSAADGDNGIADPLTVPMNNAALFSSNDDNGILAPDAFPEDETEANVPVFMDEFGNPIDLQPADNTAPTAETSVVQDQMETTAQTELTPENVQPLTEAAAQDATLIADDGTDGAPTDLTQPGATVTESTEAAADGGAFIENPDADVIDDNANAAAQGPVVADTAADNADQNSPFVTDKKDETTSTEGTNGDALFVVDQDSTIDDGNVIAVDDTTGTDTAGQTVTDTQQESSAGDDTAQGAVAQDALFVVDQDSSVDDGNGIAVDDTIGQTVTDTQQEGSAGDDTAQGGDAQNALFVVDQDTTIDDGNAVTADDQTTTEAAEGQLIADTQEETDQEPNKDKDAAVDNVVVMDQPADQDAAQDAGAIIEDDDEDAEGDSTDDLLKDTDSSEPSTEESASTIENPAESGAVIIDEAEESEEMEESEQESELQSEETADEDGSSIVEDVELIDDEDDDEEGETSLTEEQESEQAENETDAKDEVGAVEDVELIDNGQDSEEEGTATTEQESETLADEEISEEETEGIEPESELITEESPEVESESEEESSEAESEVESESELSSEAEEQTEDESAEKAKDTKVAVVAHTVIELPAEEAVVDDKGGDITRESISNVRVGIKNDSDEDWTQSETEEDTTIVVNEDQLLNFQVDYTVEPGRLSAEDKTLAYRVPEEISSVIEKYGRILDDEENIIADYHVLPDGLVLITFSDQTVEINAAGAVIDARFDFQTIGASLRMEEETEEDAEFENPEAENSSDAQMETQTEA